MQLGVFSRFDLYSLGKSDDKEDEEGILRSSASIGQIVKAENEAGIPNEKSTRLRPCIFLG